MRRDPSSPTPKGLTVKYAVRRPHPDCERLHAFKIEYALDEDGRRWQRVHREHARQPYRGQYSACWVDCTGWHIADPYEWFPGPDPARLEGSRVQNTRARVPKFDVYLIDGRRIILPKPSRA